MKKNLLKKLTIFLVTCGAFFLVACSGSSDNDEVKEDSGSLEGQSISIYCGAGIKNGFQKVADEFENETGAKVEITYGNATQIQTQIKTTQEGDIFIAGAKEEVKPVEEFIDRSVDLVKHVPVLIVTKDNPMEITGFNDLTKDGVDLILGDNTSTPIGKIADAALKEKGILEEVNIVARTTTAPEIANSISLGSANAGIVWKENVNEEKETIVETSDLDSFIKIIPAAILKDSTNENTVEEFLKYLDSDTAKKIWEANGYEIVD